MLPIQIIKQKFHWKHLGFNLVDIMDWGHPGHLPADWCWTILRILIKHQISLKAQILQYLWVDAEVYKMLKGLRKKKDRRGHIWTNERPFIMFPLILLPLPHPYDFRLLLGWEWRDGCARGPMNFCLKPLWINHCSDSSLD